MTTLTRREFLKSSGALVVSFAAPPVTGALAQAAAGKPALVPTELDSWVAVLPDGRVQAFFGKMDRDRASRSRSRKSWRTSSMSPATRWTC